GRERAGCGGVIRGNREWLEGFAKGVGSCSAFVAEFWGVLEGLCLVSRMGFTNVELSIDSQAVVHVIQAGRMQGSTVLKKIRRVMKRDWIVKVSHEYREANKVLDALPNIGCSIEYDVIFYEDFSSEIRHILVSDELGNGTPRLIVA
ncbi:putative non-LTR retroelement reverse transcriptase, partial [Trifolium medium]|nr:putative non-LTR retroelement reverse transcriptase [Trifolium medium]